MNSSTWVSSKNKYSKSGFSKRKFTVAALARSGRSLLLAVWIIRLGIFSAMSCLAMYGRRSAQAASEDLPAGEPDELSVGSEIAPPQLAGFHQKPPEPLQPHCLQPVGGTPDEAGQYVEAAAHAEDDGHPKAPTVALAPDLLEWRGHTDEQHVCTARPDFFDDGLVMFRAKIAVAEADDLDARVPDTAPFDQRLDHLGPGAEEIYAQPLRSGRRQQARHQIDAGHSLGCWLARCPQGPDHRHAVGHGKVSCTAGQRQRRIMANHAQVGGIGRDNHVGDARGAAKLETSGHCRLHGDRVKGEAQQLGPFSALHRRLIETREPGGWRTRGGPARRRPGPWRPACRCAGSRAGRIGENA